MSRQPTPEFPYTPQLTVELIGMSESIDHALVGLKDEGARAIACRDRVEITAEDLLSRGVIDSMVQFEACLREIGSNVYCLAAPIATRPGATVINPADDRIPPAYVLEVAKGESEAARRLQEFETSADGNVEKLARTGIGYGTS